MTQKKKFCYTFFLARTRFFGGNTRVTGNEFENTLRYSDTEVDEPKDKLILLSSKG